MVRAEVTGGLRAQVLVQRVCVVAVDLELGVHREGDVVVDAAELLDLGVVARLLVAELVAREADDLQALVLVGAVQRLEALVLRREAALARHVDDQQQLALVGAEILGGAVGGLDGEVVGVHRWFSHVVRWGRAGCTHVNDGAGFTRQPGPDRAGAAR